VYTFVSMLVKASPATCIQCTGDMDLKLWKPSTCSRNCSTRMRQAPLEVRLHNLLADPLAIDLLLTCVYSAAITPTPLDLLPDCPIPKAQIQNVIDSFPSLSVFSTSTQLGRAIRGRDSLGADRERLLSWLCLRFRGFLLSTPNNFRIPSMPHTQQFLLMNETPEREALFKTRARAGTTNPVFHGTSSNRLFLILTEGLRNVSGTAYMSSGSSLGPGIYLADQQGTSLGYAGSTGQSWSNSSLSNMSIMLGCELANYSPSGNGIHVISDENRVAVRYVFLLPPNYVAPLSHLVQPAMTTAFASLRSGLSV
jgi:hypothetical protein